MIVKQQPVREAKASCAVFHPLAKARRLLNSHLIFGIEGLVEQLTHEGIEFTPAGLILISRRQLCALFLRSLLTRYSNQVADPNSRLSVNYNASVVDVDLTGRQEIIEREAGSEAAHGMFSLLGQGCTAAIADAVALDSLLQQHSNQLSVVLPQFSVQQVEEGHAASDLGLIALIFYHRWLGLLYKIGTLL